MHTSTIISLLAITLTHYVFAGEKYSVSSKVTMSSVNLSHASGPKPSLSASRCRGGTGSAFTPGFVHQIATHTITGTPSAGPAMTPKEVADVVRMQAAMKSQEMNYVGGKSVPYERRRCRGDAR